MAESRRKCSLALNRSKTYHVIIKQTPESTMLRDEPMKSLNKSTQYNDYQINGCVHGLIDSDGKPIRSSIVLRSDMNLHTLCKSCCCGV